MAQRDEWEDPNVDPNPYDYWDRLPVEEASPDPGWGPPYPAPDGFEWVMPPGGQWTLQPRNGPGRYMYEPDETVTQAPEPTNYGGGGGGGGGGGIQRPGQRTPPGLGAYPMFDAPTYVKPPDFSYADFKPPTLEEARNEPGYQFAATEGVKALANQRAYQGTYRTGGAMKDILAWGNQFAEQNYGNVYNRGANTYSTNRSNAFDNYKLNLDAGLSAYDRLFQEASSEYAPKARAFELGAARDWDAFVYGADDDWRRYLADLDIGKFVAGQG